MKQRQLYSIITACLSSLAITSTPALAVDHGKRVSFAGFLSGVYQTSDQDNAYYDGGLHTAGVNSDGSIAGTQFGLNVSAIINDKLRIASQFHASANEDHYTAIIDWAFASFSVSDSTDLRVGRIKYSGGLVNETRDVGYTYPWIQPPRHIYSEEIGASHTAHESFTGFSLLNSFGGGDVTYSADLFFGNLSEEGVSRTGFSGATLQVNWDEKIIVQLAASTSTMQTDPGSTAMLVAMDDQKHGIVNAGLKVDWSNVVVYAEVASAEMGDFKDGEADVNYVTLGYRMGNFLPHVTRSTVEKGKNGTLPMSPSEETATTVGLRWDFMENAAFKIEASNIEVDQGSGLFEGTFNAGDNGAKIYRIAVDTVF